MHFASAVALALTATSLISSTLALPHSKKSNEKRLEKVGDVCYIKPTLIKYLSKTGPLSRTVQSGKYTQEVELRDDEFIIQSLSDAEDPYDTVRTAMKFEGIPIGATGCRLEFAAPSEQRIIYENGQVNMGVYRVKDVRATDSWWNQPEPLPSQPNKVQQFNPDEEPSKAVWTGSCDESLNFLFRYSDWQQEGGLYQFHQATEENGSQAGFTVGYNC